MEAAPSARGGSGILLVPGHRSWGLGQATAPRSARFMSLSLRRTWRDGDGRDGEAWPGCSDIAHPTAAKQEP